jgi:hypothetical protein
MRQAARVDGNQAEIVKALRGIPGCFVQVLGQPYDLLVGFRGLWHLLEVKDPTKPQQGQVLKPAQLDTLAKIRNAAPLHVVRTVDEALAAVGAKEWPQ